MSSKYYTPFQKTPVKWIPLSKPGALKSRPRWGAHTRIGNVWEYPPPPGTYVNQLYAYASSTLNLVRLRYWIPAGRQHVKKAINHCVTCKTIIGLPYNIPDPSLLPKQRLTQAEKFTVTDVDFTRALYIREAVAEKKDYICFFTCATTRVVHLVVVPDFSVQTFFLA